MYIYFFILFFRISVVGICPLIFRIHLYKIIRSNSTNRVGTFFRDVDVTFYHMLAVWYRNPPQTWGLPLVDECLEPFEIASHGQYNHVCTTHVFKDTNHVFKYTNQVCIIPIMYLIFQSYTPLSE